MSARQEGPHPVGRENIVLLSRQEGESLARESLSLISYRLISLVINTHIKFKFRKAKNQNLKNFEHKSNNFLSNMSH